MHSKNKGNIGELATATQLSKLGYKVFKEIGDLSKIDLIAESPSGELLRIQCKAVNIKNGVAQLFLRKSGPNYSFKYVKSDMDVFALIRLDTLEVAWIPSSVLDKRSCTFSLRVSQAKGGNDKGCRYFSEFSDLASVLRDYTRGIPFRDDDIVQTTTGNGSAKAEVVS
jgi:hypothetical protein